ncbi:MAG: T9SS type A sorting domain-containing protein, partial [Calditrichaeota bacterium]|nr:T9SS type A sorting domain-containing protein [Calditrichota bacterium]
VGVSEYQALVSWIQAHSPVNYGTEGRIVDVSVTGISEEHSNEPRDFSLSAGYPNPFNARTVFVYRVPAGKFSLSIYDVRGHLVRRVTGQSTTGELGRVVWDGRDSLGQSVATGVYVVRLQASGQVATRKVVLVR